GARPLRGRLTRPRPARPGGPRLAVPPVRRRTGGHLHPGRRRRGGARDRRGGRRAVPRPQRLPGPYAAWPGGDPGRLGARGPDPTAPRSGGPRRSHPVRVLNDGGVGTPSYTPHSVGRTLSCVGCQCVALPTAPLTSDKDSRGQPAGGPPLRGDRTVVLLP